MEEFGHRRQEIWQSDLRDAQRKQDLSGRISVVRVDCVNEKYPRVTCLGQVAATGEARRLVPDDTTITAIHGRGGGWTATFPE